MDLTVAQRRHALTVIFVTVLIDAIGFGIVLPVFPDLIITITGDTLEQAGRDAGWLAMAYAIMQFLFGPVIGGLSDRFGRRPVLIASLFAFALDFTLTGFATTLAWLYAGRMVAGITGASYSTAYAYVTDITPEDRRAQNFGLLGLAFGVGFILGPAVGGLLGGFGVRAPFFVAACLALLNGIAALFLLKESLPLRSRRRFQVRYANPLGMVVRLRERYPGVVGLVFVVFLFQLGMQVLPVVWAFFGIERFGWGPMEIGWSLAAVGLSAAVVQGGLIRVVVPLIGERRSVLIGLWCVVLSLVVYAFAWKGWVIYVGVLLSAPGDLAWPALNALMSRRVGADSQGELQGAVSSLTSLATVLAPPAAMQIFAWSSAADAWLYFPGMPFLFSAVLTLAALWLFVRTLRRWPEMAAATG